MSPLFRTCTLTTTCFLESGFVVPRAIASCVGLRRAFTTWTERRVGNPARPRVSDKSVLFPRHTPPRAGPRQAWSCCHEARDVAQALRRILSPRGSAPALVRQADIIFHSFSRHDCTLRKQFIQRSDSRSPCSAQRLAARAHTAASAARRRTVKERRKKLHPIEHATGARSREAAAAIEWPACRGYRPWRAFWGDKVMSHLVMNV